MKKKTTVKATKKTSKSATKKAAKKIARPKKKVVPVKARHAKGAEGAGAEESKKDRPKTPRFPLLPRSYHATPDLVQHDWKIIDASQQTLGRLSTQVAILLMGKHKPTFTRGMDVGDFVIVINADKVNLTGKKWDEKLYQYHTNYPGGLKTATAKEILEKKPAQLVEKAVWRMLPKSKGHLVRKWFSKLKVYAGVDHPHAAQKPQTVTLG